MRTVDDGAGLVGMISDKAFAMDTKLLQFIFGIHAASLLWECGLTLRYCFRSHNIFPF
jgi:hypothetical protein